MGTRRTRQLSPWGEGVLKRLRRLDRTVVELAAGLRRSTSTVYRWLATTPAADVQGAVDAWLHAIDARTVDWDRAPRRGEDADTLATTTRVLADRAVRMARRRAADQTSVIDAMRMLEHLAHHTFPLVAAANLLSIVLRYNDAALGAWTPERDPILLWVSGAQVWSELSDARDPAALPGRRLSALNPRVAEDLGPRLEALVQDRRRTPLRDPGRWSRSNGSAVWTEGVWYALPGTQRDPYCLWTVYRVTNGTALGPPPDPVRARLA